MANITGNPGQADTMWVILSLPQYVFAVPIKVNRSFVHMWGKWNVNAAKIGLRFSSNKV